MLDTSGGLLLRHSLLWAAKSENVEHSTACPSWQGGHLSAQKKSTCKSLPTALDLWGGLGRLCASRLLHDVFLGCPDIPASLLRIGAPSSGYTYRQMRCSLNIVQVHTPGKTRRGLLLCRHATLTLENKGGQRFAARQSLRSLFVPERHSVLAQPQS